MDKNRNQFKKITEELRNILDELGINKNPYSVFKKDQKNIYGDYKKFDIYDLKLSSLTYFEELRKEEEEEDRKRKEKEAEEETQYGFHKSYYEQKEKEKKEKEKKETKKEKVERFKKELEIEEKEIKQMQDRLKELRKRKKELKDQRVKVEVIKEKPKREPKPPQPPKEEKKGELITNYEIRVLDHLKVPKNDLEETLNILSDRLKKIEEGETTKLAIARKLDALDKIDNPKTSKYADANVLNSLIRKIKNLIKKQPKKEEKKEEKKEVYKNPMKAFLESRPREKKEQKKPPKCEDIEKCPPKKEEKINNPLMKLVNDYNKEDIGEYRFKKDFKNNFHEYKEDVLILTDLTEKDLNNAISKINSEELKEYLRKKFKYLKKDYYIKEQKRRTTADFEEALNDLHSARKLEYRNPYILVDDRGNRVYPKDLDPRNYLKSAEYIKNEAVKLLKNTTDNDIKKEIHTDYKDLVRSLRESNKILPLKSKLKIGDRIKGNLAINAKRYETKEEADTIKKYNKEVNNAIKQKQEQKQEQKEEKKEEKKPTKYSKLKEKLKPAIKKVIKEEVKEEVKKEIKKQGKYSKLKDKLKKKPAESKREDNDKKLTEEEKQDIKLIGNQRFQGTFTDEYLIFYDRIKEVGRKQATKEREENNNNPDNIKDPVQESINLLNSSIQKLEKLKKDMKEEDKIFKRGNKGRSIYLAKFFKDKIVKQRNEIRNPTDRKLYTLKKIKTERKWDDITKLEKKYEKLLTDINKPFYKY